MRAREVVWWPHHPTRIISPEHVWSGRREWQRQVHAVAHPRGGGRQRYGRHSPQARAAYGLSAAAYSRRRRTPLQFVLAARPDLVELEAELAACETALADPEVTADLRRIERVLERQERLLRRFEEIGGPGFEGEARSYLRGLGLDNSAIEQPMTELSGGQRKLVALAACLAQRPELLLLDEPETHLDLPHREYLESLVQDFTGAVVIVSHDRYLLDETVSEIAELDRGAITLWPGNYSAYTLARELALHGSRWSIRRSRRRSPGWRRRSRASSSGPASSLDERHIKQARNKQRQIDTHGEGRAARACSAARWRWSCAARRVAARRCWSCATPIWLLATTSSCWTPICWSRAASEWASLVRTARARACWRSCSLGETGADEWPALDRPQHLARLLRAGPRDARSHRNADRRHSR